MPGSPFPQRVFPFSLIRYDVTTGEPFRDPRGRCVAAAPGVCPGGEADRGGWHWRPGPPGQATPDPLTLPGEPGLLVAPVSQQYPFLGYAGGPELARGKLLTDVFRPGDVFFNSGDLLVCDAQDFLRFYDRTGDTFRYRPPEFLIPAWMSELCDSRPLNPGSRTSGPNAAHLPSRLGLNPAST